MSSFQAPGPLLESGSSAFAAPMVALFERDDEIAVPLLSQIRIAGYDVRAARTAVELFDVLTKNPVALVLVDLDGASASRREFWVALDARRRGRALQVMTFRIKDSQQEFAGDEATIRAFADVEALGPGDFPQIVEGIRERAPLRGAPPSNAPVAVGTLPSGKTIPPEASAQFGQALGAIASFMPAFSSTPPTPDATLFADQSPFAQPAPGNPFATAVGLPRVPAFGQGQGTSPFEQPYNSNPFAANPSGGSPAEPDMNPFGLSSSWSDPFGASSPSDAPNAAPNSRSGDALGAQPFANPTSSPRSQPAPGALSRPPSSAPRDWTASSSPAQSGAFGASNPSGRSGAQPSIADRWAPPDQNDSRAAAANRAFEQQETSVAPEVAFHVGEGAAGAAKLGGQGDASGAASWMARVQEAAASGAIGGGRPLSPADEKALSDVLVEGALLSPQTLEVLRGVQQMLSTVDMKLNVGELAMLFNFLSQDQYLAALLVSRGLVSPSQIASLGRVKQEMATAGQDFTLEELLVKFKVVSAEELARIHSEIGRR